MSNLARIQYQVALVCLIACCVTSCAVSLLYLYTTASAKTPEIYFLAAEILARAIMAIVSLEILFFAYKAMARPAELCYILEFLSERNKRPEGITPPTPAALCGMRLCGLLLLALLAFLLLLEFKQDWLMPLL